MSSTNYELKNIQDDNLNKSPQVLVVGGRNKPANDIIDSGQRNPGDLYKFVFIIFLIHGVGTLMPWNMFCTADAYFRNYKLQPTTNTTEDVTESLNSIRENFFTYLGIASQIPNLLFSGLNLIVDLGSGNLKTRVNLSLSIELGIFILTIVLASIDSTGWPIAFFYITMASVVILNMVGGIYQNCIFGSSAKFPPLYTNAVLIGSNLSGTYTSIVSILSIYLAPEHKTAAIYYFVTAVIAILLCLVSYNLLPFLKFYRYFDLRRDDLTRDPTDEYVIINNNNGTNNVTADDVPENLRETVDAMVPKQSNELTFGQKFQKKLDVFSKCKGQLSNVFLTFFVTLALFPTVLVDIKSQQDIISGTYFGPVFCFFVFNSAALLGNVLSYYTSWPGKDKVWILTTLRLLFIPFFLFCNYQPSKLKVRSWPVLIPYDIAYVIGNFIMAISSGYLSSICMMFVSTGLNQDEALIAGMLGGFFLIFGIFSGVMSTFLLNRIIY